RHRCGCRLHARPLHRRTAQRAAGAALVPPVHHRRRAAVAEGKGLEVQHGQGGGCGPGSGRAGEDAQGQEEEVIVKLAGPGALCALGALFLATAIQLNNGAYEPRALAMATAATLLALISALWLRFGKVVQERAFAAQWLLGLGCAAGLACHIWLHP